VNSHSLGIRSLNIRPSGQENDDHYSIIINRNTPIPSSMTRTYYTAMERLEQKRQERGLPEWEQLRFDDMSRFLRTQNEKKWANILIKMADYEMISPYSQQEVDLQVMFGSHLAHKAFGILLRITYLQIIRGRLEKG